MPEPVHVLGGGLAGCEAAWQLASRGVPVCLWEMRPSRLSPAHQSDLLAELVCSNSLRSDDAVYNAVGLLHQEMRRAGSLILSVADKKRLPAGGALAVDRHAFAREVTKLITAHPLITLKREEATSIPQVGDVIVASGPLTSDALASAIVQLTGKEALHFFDALAPIVAFDSLDQSQVWFQSRYDKGDGKDYINCAMDEAQYKAFVAALLEAETVPFRDFEKDTPYFEGCLPIEVMAARGVDTLRYGPLKPVGLTNPHKKERPYAVVQLRQDNALGTLWNMVGFQTKMRYGEQERVLRMIPGLEKAEFARLGGIHRNSFIKSPQLLDSYLRLRTNPSVRFAGQLIGVEGYCESAATGLLAGIFVAAARLGKEIPPPPVQTALGALLVHITGGARSESFQPMNVNFSLFPPITAVKSGRARKEAYTERAREALGVWVDNYCHCEEGL
ncbi:MAG: methylenetetrahydrofolate--tRNA-(uracil(54)-C(5))-methyltransferase (FADH(2)-oxidizing) TrmFO [Alphaproteobacteria bacterium]|nr:methylenetetrahydrofolate--tRNA-(uracil(54)-C(5))-methyltransferase (FADH(2)-oxidizing) TrmFO [Alphaproteobacteria bacterium]